MTFSLDSDSPFLDVLLSLFKSHRSGSGMRRVLGRPLRQAGDCQLLGSG